MALALKRFFDIAVSFVALLLLLPLLLIVALLIRLESAGSPLFFQERVGKDGKLFRIVKFRSMVRDAASLGATSTSQNDPRITRAGAFIRKTSIDELPQLWNVLMGEMSLIGPRPALARNKALYTAEHWTQRHMMRPGITGWAQVNGRSNITVEQQIAYDIDYITHWSLQRDAQIIRKTFQILCGQDAN